MLGRILLVSVACASACSSKPAPPDLHQGGSLMLPHCGYAVTTRDGASRPSFGTPSLGSDPAPKQIHLTLPADPARTLAVLWRTGDESTLATTVQYGVGDATDKTEMGFTFVYDLGTGGQVRMHETHLCGLAADTAYSYRVGGGPAGKEIWSPVYHFRTAPDRSASPDAQLTMLVLGDTRDGYATWGQTLQMAFQKAPPDVILFSGDAVTLGIDQDEWDTWFSAAEPLLVSTPMVFAHGNHEINSVNWFSELAQPGDEQNFGLDLGPVHLTVANDTPASAADLTGMNAQLLDRNLQAGASAPWNLLMNHKAMWSAANGPHTGDPETVRAAWQPIIDRDRVDLVLSGHDHDYERTRPMRGATPAASPAAGTVYLVAGSAGAPLYPSGRDVWTEVSESTYSFVIATARLHALSLTAYRNDGSSLDAFTLTK